LGEFCKLFIARADISQVLSNVITSCQKLMQDVYQYSCGFGVGAMLAQCINIAQESRNSENGLQVAFQVSSELSNNFTARLN
jgi:hypothetical protein